MSEIDVDVLHALYALRDPAALQVFVWITELGSTLVIGGIALCVGLCLLSRARLAYFAGLCVSVMGTVAVVFLLKEIVARARPDVLYQVYAEDSFAFPSGHAALSLALYGFLSYLAWKTLPRNRAVIASCAAALLIGLIGFSRLYLGLHYASDVAGGYAIGGAFLALGILLAERLKRHPILS